ncbi:MAG: rhodanese-like domain-containing protein [Terriglobales bacterium]
MNGTISAEELKKFAGRGEAQWVDVRSASEYAAGHVPGAINIPMEQIEARLDDLRPDRPIVLICQSGKRARLTAALLETRRTDVTVLDGGTSAWVSAGSPVVVSSATRWALERQVRLVAGLLVVIGAVLALTVNPRWLYLSGFVGLGLVFAGLTNICAMASLLCKMPWNRSRRLRPAATSVPGQTCSLRNVSSTGGDGETIVS